MFLKLILLRLLLHQPNSRIEYLCRCLSLSFENCGRVFEIAAPFGKLAVGTTPRLLKMSDRKGTLKFAPSKSDNPIWEYYDKCTTEDKSKCRKCGSLLSCKGGSTGAMRGHLKAKHEIEVEFKIKPTAGAGSSPGTSDDKGRLLKCY